ncbi:MAG: PHP domain-containing protein [Gemmatimonadetes bacterium]|nr:PHP domain-containing protein [Gemmatimonadota bacterium]
MRIDLHLHSTASDGSLAPRDVVHAAREGGLHVIALADHDTTAGVSEAATTSAGLVHVIPAIEISATHAGTELHLLGYYFDRGHPKLVEYENGAMARRRERMRSMIERLAGLGTRVSFAAVEAAAGGASVIARPHLARALVDAGHATSVSDAFDRWIGNAGPAYVAVDLIAMEQAIELVRAAGGLSVWAHPDIEMFRRDIGRFRTWGLDGVECYRPRSTPPESLELESSAQRLGLVATGGSDWHGSWNGRLGSFFVGRDEVGPFLERGGI